MSTQFDFSIFTHKPDESKTTIRLQEAPFATATDQTSPPGFEVRVVVPGTLTTWFESLSTAQDRFQLFERIPRICNAGHSKRPTKPPPREIVAERMPICHRCKNGYVIPGQPGRRFGLCYGCWSKENTI